MRPSLAVAMDALSRIGVGLDVTETSFNQVQARMVNARERWGIIVGFGTGRAADFPNGSSFLLSLLSSSSIHEDHNQNHSFVGAAPGQLADWGYSVTEIPSARGA
jgi:hypothetical protein